MIVHFISGKTNIEENIEYLRRVITTIHLSGHVVARDWLEPAYLAATQGLRGEVDWRMIFEENVEGLNKADVLIAEATEKSFGVGYQVALASQQRKPILLLQREGVGKASLASGITIDCVELKHYREDNLESIIEQFLEENNIQAKDMRFNFFINRSIYNYLRWASSKTGKTKAEILRDLVEKEIEKREVGKG